MKRPVGVVVLAMSFITVAALIIIGSNWYWVSEPADSPWHPVQTVVEHMIAFALAGIGVGLLMLSRAARWLAFFAVLALVAIGIGATVWDALSQRQTWLFLDIVLLVAIVMAAVYLLFPRVSGAFRHEGPGPVMRH